MKLPKLKHINLAYLENISGNDKQFMEMYIGMFIKTLPEILANIEDAYSGKDWKKLADASHKAKSNIVNMGLTKMADELKLLELKARDGKETESYEAVINLFRIVCKESLEESELLIQALKE